MGSDTVETLAVLFALLINHEAAFVFRVHCVTTGSVRSSVFLIGHLLFIQTKMSIHSSHLTFNAPIIWSLSLKRPNGCYF